MDGSLTYDTRGSLGGFASVSPHVVVNVEEARVETGLAPWSAHAGKCISLIEQSRVESGFSPGTNRVVSVGIYHRLTCKRVEDLYIYMRGNLLCNVE